MAGTYIEGQSKTLSGVYSLIKGIVAAAATGSRGIVAYPFTANWGPVKILEELASGRMFDTTYNTKENGTVGTTSAQKVRNLAYRYDLSQAPDFKEQPQKLLGYRMATAAAAKGTAVLPAGAGTAWTLATAYESDRAFVAVVKAGVAVGATAVQITENGVLLASLEDTTVAGLAAKIGATGIVKVQVEGTALPDVVAGVNFAGGNNGAAVTTAEYSTFLTEIEADRTAYAMALDGVTDEAILTTVETWLKRVRGEGFYLDWARGGAAAWDNDLTQANTKSKAVNHRGVINVGNGCDGYTAAEMAIFVASYVASIALNKSVTDQVVPFTKVNVKSQLTAPNRETAKLAGTLVFVNEGSSVVIDEGVNTLTAPVGDEVAGMGKIRISTAIDYITGSVEVFGNAYKKAISNTPAARQAYASAVEDKFFKPLVRMEVVQPGYSYKEDPDYHGKTPTHTPKLDEAFFYSEYMPVDSPEKIYQKFGVKF